MREEILKQAETEQNRMDQLRAEGKKVQPTGSISATGCFTTG